MKPSPQLPHSANKIFFICTVNICRSVSAAGFFSKLNEKSALSLSIQTAGIAALDGKKASEQTLALLGRHQIDMNHHQSRKLTSEMVETADVLFVMEKNHRAFILKEYPHAVKKVFMLSDFYPDQRTFPQESDIPDPIGKDDFFYSNVNEMIQLCCASIFGQLQKRN